MFFGTKPFPVRRLKVAISLRFAGDKDSARRTDYSTGMTFSEIAPIFLVVETGLLAILLLAGLSRRRRVTMWIAAVAVLAGLGLIVFVLYAFPAAGPLAATHGTQWR